MKISTYSALIAFIFLGGCSAQTKTVEVRISPRDYKVNSVVSPLATPAVDEVVRIKPDRVLILRCPGTPHSKLIQFEVELRARHMSVLEMANIEEGCPL